MLLSEMKCDPSGFHIPEFLVVNRANNAPPQGTKVGTVNSQVQPVQVGHRVYRTAKIAEAESGMLDNAPTAIRRGFCFYTGLMVKRIEDMDSPEPVVVRRLLYRGKRYESLAMLAQELGTTVSRLKAGVFKGVFLGHAVSWVVV